MYYTINTYNSVLPKIYRKKLDCVCIYYYSSYFQLLLPLLLAAIW